jgi:hypothetical protein
MTVNTLNSRSFSRSVQVLGLVAGTMIGTVCLSLGTIGEAKAFTFSEPPDAGSVISSARDTSNGGLDPVITTSTIQGTLAASGQTADLFKILISSDGLFTAAAIPGFDPNGLAQPDPIPSPFLYLFDSLGTVSTAISGPTISTILTAGDYFLAITKAGITPNTNRQGTLQNWSQNGIRTERNVAYKIELTHTPTAVPTPALLPGMVGMGLSFWRKRKEESLV